MPYISQEARQRLQLPYESPHTSGELNFFFTMIAKEYLGGNPNYQKFNDVIGALEGCKLELYARLVRPYEDTKIAEHGDVYV